jgi:hypothetical protein
MTALLCISIVINRLARVDFPNIALFWSWDIFYYRYRFLYELPIGYQRYLVCDE